MKRKGWITIGVVLGVLALVIIVIWPAAPLWANLGLKPFCIQGSWPDFQIVSCSDQEAAPAQVTPQDRATSAGQAPIPIIVDDDGSPDGMVALLYFLKNPGFEVKAVTISCGEAHPEVFAARLVRLLAGLGRADIPVGIGSSSPLQGNNAFPDPWRQASDDFWNIAYPERTSSQEPVSAVDLIVQTINSSAQPVMVFVSGTHTNLAEALRLDPGISKNIQSVYIMGGSIHVPGNINSAWPSIDNRVAEWNIWVDPLAAREVITSGLPIHLVPLDATDQVAWTKSDAQSWTSSGSPEGKLAGDFLQYTLDSWSANEVLVWDLVTAVDAADPGLCPEVSLAVDIIVDVGPNQGQTVITDQSPNVNVCLDPDAEQMRANAAAILGQ